ncbi:MAG: LysE family translocator [Pseudomonadota bacterium]
MNDLAGIAAPLLAFAVAAGSPGPATLAVAATAMARGRRAGCWLGAGLALGLTFWGIVAAAGLGALMLQSVTALTILRILGGLYLLYLAWKAAQSAIMTDAAAAEAVKGAAGWGLFRQGLALNLMNPKAVLAWLAVLAIGLPAGAEAGMVALVTGLCAALGLALYLVYVALFSLPAVMGGYRRARRGIEAAVAALFGLAGLRLLTTRVETP